MDFQFDKYQGAGNDFIILDDRTQKFHRDDHDRIKWLCNRNFGIGADGLILIRDSENADFKMVYFNSNGREGSLCGNGSRCAVAFCRANDIVGLKATFETSDGLHKAVIDQEGLVCLEMKDVASITNNGDSLFIDTGSPHHLEFVSDVLAVNVKAKGAEIRYRSPYFEAGSNVSFIEKINEEDFKIRTYERGVEDETLACGTGAIAAAIGVHSSGQTKLNGINIHALGGVLRVEFFSNSDQYENVKLIGPAVQVFSGTIRV